MTIQKADQWRIRETRFRIFFGSLKLPCSWGISRPQEQQQHLAVSSRRDVAEMSTLASITFEGEVVKNIPVKSFLLSAAVTGLLTAAAPAFATTSSSQNTAPTLSKAGQILTTSAFQGEKHSCKGQNSCKGQGGCKSGDNGCKGKNSCKGKGGCATDGSKHLA